jgi:hypothetical protein
MTTKLERLRSRMAEARAAGDETLTSMLEERIDELSGYRGGYPFPEPPRKWMRRLGEGHTAWLARIRELARKADAEEKD